MAIAINIRPNLDALPDDPLHGEAASIDKRVNILDMESAASALDSLSCFVHGDASDMGNTSRLDCGKGDVPDIYTKPFAGHWFPVNAGDARELTTPILFLHLENFATPLTVACKLRAEWTFSPEPKNLESRPNSWTVRVTGV
ncbi:hypothetical protein [Bradyrhizobium sediminis]|uniref:hypothetical protein n=1 Tax=Bradyrhizobium sediminis TaxID=2840469 RepID=UPI00201C1844|nr:hypothetical protein [Bradyrhizobium sediminis]